MREGSMALLLLAVAIFLQVAGAGAGDLHPLVLVPGHAGNQLEARLTDAYVSSNPSCQLAHKEKGWFRLWLDYDILADAAHTRCFAEQMTLHYDPDKDDYHNTPGVETRVPFFGSTQGFRYKDPNLKQNSEYMATLVKSLEQVGYREGDNFFGAPYDFRHGLAALGHHSAVGSQFLQDLRELIEEASALNGGKPVIMLTHSLGGLFGLHLLNQNPLKWRQRFIKHFIALSAPWGGTVVDMMVFASGNTLGIPTVDPLLLRRMTWTQQSNVWLLPSPKIFGLKPIILARNGSKYTAFDIPQFFADIGFPEGIYPYKARILPLLQQLPAPGVPVTCITGTGISTVETLLYEDGFKEKPVVVHGDGDGLVNLISLLALEVEWSEIPQQALKVMKIPNITHTTILQDDMALREIIQEILDINSLVLSSAD